MPFSARTRTAVRDTLIAVAATVALLGFADTASDTTGSHARGTTVTAQADGASTPSMPACASCSTGF